MSDNTQSTVVPDDFWNKVDENVTQENQGGGGWWVGFSSVFCFHVSPPENSGVPKSKTFFEYDPTVVETKKSALERAKQYAVEIGSTKRVFAGVMFHVAKKNFLSAQKREKMEQDDYYYFVPAFASRVDQASGQTRDSDYSKHILPALRQFNLIGGSDVVYWGHLAFVESTYQPERQKREDGSDPGRNNCVVPDAVYPNKEAAIKAMGVDAEASDTSTGFTILTEFPTGYNADTWKQIENDLVTEIKSGKGIALIAKEWDIPKATLNELKTKLGL